MSAWFRITLTRDDDQKGGLETLKQIIVNGMSCISAEYEIEETSNSIEILFRADPEKIGDLA